MSVARVAVGTSPCTHARRAFVPSRASGQLVGRASVVLLASLGCGGGGGDSSPAPTAVQPPPVSVAVVLAPATIRMGESSTARAIGLDAGGATTSGGTPLWTVEANGVALITEAGVLTGIAPGRTTVTASLRGTVGHGDLIVLNVPVASVAIEPATMVMGIGSARSLSAVLRDARGAQLPGRATLWSVSDSSIATVTAEGEVRALARGSVVIAARTEGVVATAPLIVTAPIASVGVSPSTANLVVGQSLPLAALLRDSAAKLLPDRPVVWTSNAKSVATVSDAGVVTARTAGTVTIAVTCEGRTGSAVIAVTGSGGSAFEISIAEPVAGAIIADTLLVTAGVKSAFPIVGVVASGSTKSAEMKLTPVGALGGGLAWVAKVLLADLPYGPVDVVVTARDDHGGVGVASVTIIRDPSKLTGGSGTGGGGGFKVIAPPPVPGVP